MKDSLRNTPEASFDNSFTSAGDVSFPSPQIVKALAFNSNGTPAKPFNNLATNFNSNVLYDPFPAAHMDYNYGSSPLYYPQVPQLPAPTFEMPFYPPGFHVPSPVSVASPPTRMQPTPPKSAKSTSPKAKTPTKNACSVCRAGSKSLAMLVPCEHPICATCLTAALNIVGEKRFGCRACGEPVTDFKLGAIKAPEPSEVEKAFDTKEALVDPQNEDDFWLSKSTSDKASTEDVDEQDNENELVILRIDNVPWDITPPTLLAFLNAPVPSRAHVLLDNRGKTRSHAYAEVPAVRARAALRGQGLGDSALGTGKRRRGVVVTRAGVAELLADVSAMG